MLTLTKVIEYENPEDKSEDENPEDVEDTDNAEKGRYENENPETADKVRDITSSYYDQAGELARNKF